MGSSSYILAKRLLPSMAETCRTHGWSLLPKYTVPFSSLANAREFVDNGEIEEGRNLNPISISTMNLQLLPSFMDRYISSKGSLSSMADAFRTHDWPLLLRYTVPFSSMGSTAVSLNDEEIDGGKRLKRFPISDEDLKLPFYLTNCHSYLYDDPVVSELRMLLPSMAETFKAKDWSVLRKFSSMDSKLNIEDALKSELAAICVWFLFTEQPAHVKGVVARILTFISFGTKTRKLFIDKTDVENLVGRILVSGNKEAQRQVCLALSVLAECRSKLFLCLAITLGAGIHDKLFHIVLNLGCNPELTYPVLSAVASVSQYGNCTRKKLAETELLHSWLTKLSSRKDDKSILADTCRTVAGIARQQCDCELWDRVKDILLPRITDALCDKMTSVRQLRGVALALHKITKYGSSDQIEDVVKMDGLKFLDYACSLDDLELVGTSVKAIRYIMRCGKANAEAVNPEATVYDNKYSEVIDGYSGWKPILHVRRRLCIADPSVDRIIEDLLSNYMP